MTVKIYKIGDICTIIRGSYPTMKTEPGKYPLVVTAAYRRSASTYQLEGPAVCVPLISSTGHGDAALHRVHYQEGRFALANLLVALIPKDKNICDPKYLYHLLMAKKDEYFVPLMLGTANVSLKERDIAGVEIPLPLLAEQHCVVSRIEQLTTKIQEAETLHREISTEQRRMLLAAYARIVDGAKWFPMESVAPLVRRSVKIDLLGEYHELGIRSFGNGTFHKPPISGAALGSKKVYCMEPGDLVFNIVFAWEGAVAVVQPHDRGRIGSHRFLTCVPKDGLALSSFLCFHFLTNRGLEDLGVASPGGAGRNRTLGLEALARIEVPVPPIEKQQWFVSLMSRTEESDRLRAGVAKELDALMPSILSRAFRGEL